jgi:hypothetical protein
LKDGGVSDRCADTEGWKERKRELDSLGHVDHIPICIGAVTEITPEVAVSAKVFGVTVITWETFDNT